jgi:hypothetical protein
MRVAGLKSKSHNARDAPHLSTVSARRIVVICHMYLTSTIVIVKKGAEIFSGEVK